MNFFYTVEIPKETDVAAPYRETLRLEYGTITNVTVVILSGHAGLTHIRFYYHETQIYPHNAESWYTGDGLTIKFPDNQLIDTPPYEIIAIGYNEDIRYNHMFLIGINVLREFKGAAIQTQDYDSYIGKTGE